MIHSFCGRSMRNGLRIKNTPTRLGKACKNAVPLPFDKPSRTCPHSLPTQACAVSGAPAAAYSLTLWAPCSGMYSAMPRRCLTPTGSSLDTLCTLTCSRLRVTDDYSRFLKDCQLFFCLWTQVSRCVRSGGRLHSRMSAPPATGIWPSRREMGVASVSERKESTASGKSARS